MHGLGRSARRPVGEQPEQQRQFRAAGPERRRRWTGFDLRLRHTDHRRGRTYVPVAVVRWSADGGRGCRGTRGTGRSRRPGRSRCPCSAAIAGAGSAWRAGGQQAETAGTRGAHLARSPGDADRRHPDLGLAGAGGGGAADRNRDRGQRRGVGDRHGHRSAVPGDVELRRRCGRHLRRTWHPIRPSYEADGRPRTSPDCGHVYTRSSACSQGRRTR